MNFRIGSLLVCMLLATLPAAAQSSPVVSDELWAALANEISGDISFSHLRNLTLYHAPNGSYD